MQASVSGQFACATYRHFLCIAADTYMMETVELGWSPLMDIAGKPGKGCPNYVRIVLPDRAAASSISVRDVVREPSIASQLLTVQPGSFVCVETTPYATYLSPLGNLNVLNLAIAAGTLDLCLDRAPVFEGGAWSKAHNERLQLVFTDCGFDWAADLEADGTVVEAACDHLQLESMGRATTSKEVYHHIDIRDIPQLLTGNRTAEQRPNRCDTI